MTCPKTGTRNQAFSAQTALLGAACIGTWASLQPDITTSSWIKQANNTQIQRLSSIEARARARKNGTSTTSCFPLPWDESGAPQPLLTSQLCVSKLLGHISGLKKVAVFGDVFLIWWNSFPSKGVAIPTLNCFSKTPVLKYSCVSLCLLPTYFENLFS